MIVSFTVSSADACTSHAFLLAARVLLDVKAAFFLPSATAEEEDRTCLIAFVGDDMVVVVVVVIIIFIVRCDCGSVGHGVGGHDGTTARRGGGFITGTGQVHGREREGGGRAAGSRPGYG